MATYPIQQLFYDGKVQSATSGKTFKTIDPSTGKILAEVQSASESDVDAAINAAQSAFHSWSQTSPSYRARILLKADELLRDRNDKIAEIETHDTGKPFSETSTVDIVTGAEVLAFYANLVASGGLNGETTSLRPDAWIYTKKEALGVCVGIGAWNYPIQIALWKSAPCLAAGNCIIYKPSEFTPLHGLILAQIYSEAGLPAGVFNLVHGDKLVGSYLTSHPKIAKVSFTGQVPTGQKSPLIILSDVDIEKAVDGAMMANFFSSGQVCTNGTRVFVPRKLQSAFEKRLIEKMQYVRSLEPMDPNSNFGPLVSEIHHTKVLKYIEHGMHVDKARLIYGGTDRPSKIPVGYENGYWIQPTIFTDCTDDMKITQEEIFGPVLCILPYDTIEEAIIRANNTQLGLAAGVFGRDIDMCHGVISKLEAGITWINTWGESPAEMSVGGWKMSGLGVENGKRGLSAWVREKSTLVEGSGNVATAFSKL
ncbi:BgTH12-07127 [Blumeria graminis f. sp. triticale]|uniref:aldehyde dehydrogenase (NAD(+)) n=3 Tax=Blumeria graminis TaxID=34373 RepID=A0A381L8L1_BLUGR|nr:Cytoplasmic aldehyde dehydrogenase [Blumeria graminis f. sp. tritici 96224]CAD6506200.1 BgTH12-07127 [Blumeria graminis f. sp. triticale]VDB94921.1 Bgt-5528 [Blumeria graminis f. sp. tritici]